jgi:hypothetical protein
VVTGVDTPLVDQAVGCWLAGRAGLGGVVDTPGGQAGERPGADGEPSEADDAAPVALVAVAMDGKTLRGSTDGDGNQVHLLAAATHEQGLSVTA